MSESSYYRLLSDDEYKYIESEFQYLHDIDMYVNYQSANKVVNRMKDKYPNVNPIDIIKICTSVSVNNFLKSRGNVDKK